MPYEDQTLNSQTLIEQVLESFKSDRLRANSKHWEYKTIKYCWCCGIIETKTGNICSFCIDKFPVKK